MPTFYDTVLQRIADNEIAINNLHNLLNNIEYQLLDIRKTLDEITTKDNNDSGMFPSLSHCWNNSPKNNNES